MHKRGCGYAAPMGALVRPNEPALPGIMSGSAQWRSSESVLPSGRIRSHSYTRQVTEDGVEQATTHREVEMAEANRRNQEHERRYGPEDGDVAFGKRT